MNQQFTVTIIATNAGQTRIVILDFLPRKDDYLVLHFDERPMFRCRVEHVEHTLPPFSAPWMVEHTCYVLILDEVA